MEKDKDTTINKKDSPGSQKKDLNGCRFCKEITVNGDETIMEGDFISVIFDPNGVWDESRGGVTIEKIDEIEMLIAGEIIKRHFGYEIQKICPSCNRALSKVIRF